MRQFITRQSRGKHFTYQDGNGQSIRDDKVLKRIKSLAVPPAWKNVHISTSPHAKILATGTDAAGRKQALYHPDFRAAQDQSKFERILEFGKHLPSLRRQVDKDLARRKLTKEKVCACVVRLMDDAHFRIGNEQYAKEHGHYGITTLRRKHLDINTTSVTFDFVGKSGQQQHKTISDRQIAQLIKQLDELPGYEVFQYIDEDGLVKNLDSAIVNSYIKQHMGDAYSAKDFRTWGGTLMAASELAVSDYLDSTQARKKFVTTCIKRVAKQLGNTPAITRASYIDPRVLHAFEANEIAKVRNAVAKMRPRKYMKPEERCVLQLLRQAS